MGCTSSQTEEPYMRSDSYNQRSFSKISRASFADEYFTQDQKRIIRESWAYLEDDPVGKGSKIFLNIFEIKPDTKKLFPFGKLSNDEMAANPLFRGHSVRFMHAVGSVVKNIDALDVSCGPTLVRLGGRHAWITNFIDEYLDVFKLAINKVFEEELGHKCSSELMEAWNVVFNFIALKMNEGFTETLANDNKKANSVTDIGPDDKPADSDHGSHSLVTSAPQSNGSIHKVSEAIVHHHSANGHVNNCTSVHSTDYSHASQLQNGPVSMYSVPTRSVSSPSDTEMMSPEGTDGSGADHVMETSDIQTSVENLSNTISVDKDIDNNINSDQHGIHVNGNCSEMKTVLNPSFLDETVNCVNSVTHGQQGIDSDDNMTHTSLLKDRVSNNCDLLKRNVRPILEETSI